MAKVNANLKPTASINDPNINGITAPPTIAIHNNPEACAFKSPKPSKLNVKIVGNIMELNNPTANIDHIEINPVVLIEITIMEIERIAQMLKTLAGDKILVKYAPTKRPIMEPTQ